MLLRSVVLSAVLLVAFCAEQTHKPCNIEVFRNAHLATVRCGHDLVMRNLSEYVSFQAVDASMNISDKAKCIRMSRRASMPIILSAEKDLAYVLDFLTPGFLRRAPTLQVKPLLKITSTSQLQLNLPRRPCELPQSCSPFIGENVKSVVPIAALGECFPCNVINDIVDDAVSPLFPYIFNQILRIFSGGHFEWYDNLEVDFETKRKYGIPMETMDVMIDDRHEEYFIYMKDFHPESEFENTAEYIVKPKNDPTSPGCMLGYYTPHLGDRPSLVMLWPNGSGPDFSKPLTVESQNATQATSSTAKTSVTTTITPEPTTTAPEITTSTPEPTISIPQPTTSSTMPTTSIPMSTTSTPKSTTSTPKPAESMTLRPTKMVQEVTQEAHQVANKDPSFLIPGGRAAKKSTANEGSSSDSPITQGASHAANRFVFSLVSVIAMALCIEG